MLRLQVSGYIYIYKYIYILFCGAYVWIVLAARNDRHENHLILHLLALGFLFLLSKNESCHMWMRQIIYESGMSHVKGMWTILCCVCRCPNYYFPPSYWRHNTVGGGKSISFCCCRILDESCQIWMSDVTYEWVMSHMRESCHIWVSHVTYEWVMSHMNESCHIWMSHVMYEWAVSYVNES